MDYDPGPGEPPAGHAPADEASASGEASLACNCCRRRKLKCSREVPACQQCRKAGNALENIVHKSTGASGAQTQSQSSLPTHLDDNQHEQYNTLAFFAREFQRFNESQNQYNTPSSSNGDSGRPQKRRRLESFAAPPTDAIHIDRLPLDDDLASVLEAYFTHVHPWIPMIHEARLRRRLAADTEQLELGIVLHAMTLVAAKFIPDEQASKRWTLGPDHASDSRDHLIAVAMRSLSVENVQALIMLAFDDLAVEGDEDDAERQTLLRPCISLPAPEDWTEVEERRRVFWNAFNLDRLCSVTTGWNTSLTSDDVHRRLPCDGIKWRKEDEVTTPYFGIWDKSAARIGNPIAFLPEVQTPSETGTSPGTASSPVDMSTVGAFAYCIEATESLSRVTTYFLQQRVNMRDQRDLGRWLTRFKELDLRLVHWKMLLPHKWKVDTSSQRARMDPNLTLAHITHNASMILLHQPIAFPLPAWPFKDRLPSHCSAHTCQAAAGEIATIARNYLQNAPPAVPVTSQFAFCLYVASRVCLVQWRHGQSTAMAVAPLAPAFWLLLESLDIMAQRWAGPHAVDMDAAWNLASKYAAKLRDLYQRCLGDGAFHIHVLGYIGEIDETAQQEYRPPTTTRTRASARATYGAPLGMATPTTRSMQPPPSIDPAQQAMDGPRGQSSQYRRASIPTSNLGEISQLLMDQQFVDMDRIISYDDGMFGSEFEAGPW
ncbi:uncharacterized protein F5Z01DRAFT_627356 [Emericellopsis atlantica]|uniref:Zn(2)-C6 fungal-type domain-containing protein n=1 Tax=Emericellopsis atlantica TaxID=2614577 RepID=A0A9P8CLP3_9HYPO|nr:uncharacterized protein F5Z01DRAFT_627356 [Emericellopsis atlantica]KAG9251623.1 hypothetical protein F5Z01DRAFT_627356 [Emericellopsis atlantica]